MDGREEDRITCSRWKYFTFNKSKLRERFSGLHLFSLFFVLSSSKFIIPYLLLREQHLKLLVLNFA